MDGSLWVAKRDDPGPLPGDGWMLAAKAGSKGKQGDRGPAGPPGPMGPRGRGIAKAWADVGSYALVLEYTDGSKEPVDLRGLFERYHEETNG